jgi:hypothetical protein
VISAVVGEGVAGQQLADHDWMMHGITGVLDTGMEWVQYTAEGLISGAPRPMPSVLPQSAQLLRKGDVVGPWGVSASGTASRPFVRFIKGFRL